MNKRVLDLGVNVIFITGYKSAKSVFNLFERVFAKSIKKISNWFFRSERVKLT